MNHIHSSVYFVLRNTPSHSPCLSQTLYVEDIPYLSLRSPPEWTLGFQVRVTAAYQGV